MFSTQFISGPTARRSKDQQDHHKIHHRFRNEIKIKVKVRRKMGNPVLEPSGLWTDFEAFDETP
jgi:hypothetical protein